MQSVHAPTSGKRTAIYKELHWPRLAGIVFAPLMIMAYQVWPAAAQDLVATTDPLPAEEQLKRFHLPPGFEIQLVAAEPEIRKPINLNFDASGRLYATQSEEYPFPAAEGQLGRDVVRVFGDLDDSGRARQVRTVVDGLNIPIGLLPTSDGIIFYSIPTIQHGRDTNADGLADQRNVLYHTFGFRDTHGMASSFTPWVDGWIYACHGFSNTSEVQGADGQKIVMNSGNTFRMRADGSHVEQFTFGQVNPFGLAFDHLGNLFSSDCHTLPAYTLLRGAVYPSFGKPHDGLGFGPTMMSHNHGSTGIAGIVYYHADHFPKQYQHTLFIGNPVTGRINHDRLETSGSTYRAIEQPDFLRCDDPWFRPVDVKLGPDGALYVADFYNRIIGHYEVPLTHPGRDRERGRIWRIVYRGDDSSAKPLQKPRNLFKSDLAQLYELLEDANLLVRTMAVNQLVERGPESGKKIADAISGASASAAQRAFGLWVLQRLGQLDLSTIEKLAGDPEPLVRVHLIKALGERERWSEGDEIAHLVRDKLRDSDAFVRRAAADALGSHVSPNNIRALLDASHECPADDANLRHVFKMALRDHLLIEGGYEQLATTLERTDSDDRLIAEASLGVPQAAAAQWLFSRLKTQPVDAVEDRFVEHALRHLPADRLPEFYQLAQIWKQDSPERQANRLKSLRRAVQQRGLNLPDDVQDWAADLAQTLLNADAEAGVSLGLDLARELRTTAAHPAIVALLGPAGKYPNLRAAALDAAVELDASGSIAALQQILSTGETTDLRQKVAAKLGAINSPQSREVLAKQLPLVPERLAIEIASALSGGNEGADLLLTAIEQGKASPRLLLEKAVADRLRAAKPPNLEQRLASLTTGLPEPDERIQSLLAERRRQFAAAQGDAANGRQVFVKNCAACHRVGGEGAKVGPELDGVGIRGVERIMEDVLDPNRNVDQAFRLTQLLLDDGRIVSGLLLREEGETLVLADGQGKEIAVAKSDVDEQTISTLSPMPANVADLVSESDFRDLMAYLIQQRQSKPE